MYPNLIKTPGTRPEKFRHCRFKVVLSDISETLARIGSHNFTNIPSSRPIITLELPSNHPIINSHPVESLINALIEETAARTMGYYFRVCFGIHSRVAPV
jgi:hypothetical protein